MAEINETNRICTYRDRLFKFIFGCSYNKWTCTFAMLSMARTIQILITIS